MIRNALKFIAACFLTAAFVYMFVTIEAHFVIHSYQNGYKACLMEFPGVVPEKTIATSVDP